MTYELVYHCVYYVECSFQIDKLVLRDISMGSSVSKPCAKGIFQMVSLKSLKLSKLKVEEKLFSVMADLAPKSQVMHHQYT